MKTKDVMPLGISHMAKHLGFDQYTLIEARNRVKIEKFLQREEEAKKAKWLLETATRNEAPSVFYVKWECKHLGISINTHEREEKRGINGKWYNTTKATMWLKQELTKKCPDWQDHYTFEYSFLSARINGITKYCMFPSIRRKMESASKYVAQGGTVKDVRRVRDHDISNTLTHGELEQLIISGELDNCDLQQESVVAMAAQRLLAAIRQDKMEKSHSSRMARRRAKWDYDIEMGKLEFQAENAWTNEESFDRRRADGQKDAHMLTDEEYNLMLIANEIERPELAEYILDASKPTFQYEHPIVAEAIAESEAMTYYHDWSVDMRAEDESFEPIMSYQDLGDILGVSRDEPEDQDAFSDEIEF